MEIKQIQVEIYIYFNLRFKKIWTLNTELAFALLTIHKLLKNKQSKSSLTLKQVLHYFCDEQSSLQIYHS